MNIIITLIILGIIVFVHELGHFITAKFFKMSVSEFSLGIGPTLFSYNGLHTTYSIRVLPLGGFVNIKGMEVDSTEVGGFNSKSPFQRFIVLIAGVIMNFILAYFILFISVIYSGKTTVSENPIIGNIVKNSKSYKDLKIGDKIIAIDGHKINTWNDISRINRKINKGTLTLNIKRDNKIIIKNIKLTYSKSKNLYYIGILPKYSVTRYGFIDGITASFKTFTNLVNMIITGFKELVVGKVNLKDISGPVGITKIVGQVSQAGVLNLFILTALLSINIGFFNLLPIPALDGGRIVFVLLEILGIKVNKKLEEKFHRVGIILLFLLIIIITLNDFKKIF